MAKFDEAFNKMMDNEGGYLLTNTPGDNGGQTYAGISRNRFPSWPGFVFVNKGETPPTQMVRDFYQAKLWEVVKGDYILHQKTAETIFDFAVNAGTGTSIKLAQITAGVVSDGQVGPKTLTAINAIDDDEFVTKFALAKVARYHAIVTKDRSQGKFLLGWIGRVLRGVV